MAIIQGLRNHKADAENDIKVLIKVKPNSKTNSVNKSSENEFVVRVKVPAKEGRANDAVIELLSGYFNIPKSRIAILKGRASRTKVIDIS